MPARKTPPKEPDKPNAAEQQPLPARSLPRLHSSPVITHNEVQGRIDQGGCLRGVVLEAQDNEGHPRYAAFLLSSWRKEYTVLGFDSKERPRLFRGVDRLLALVRREYGFKGTIAVRLADGDPPRKHSWRIVSHGADFARPSQQQRMSEAK